MDVYSNDPEVARTNRSGFGSNRAFCPEEALRDCSLERVIVVEDSNPRECPGLRSVKGLVLFRRTYGEIKWGSAGTLRLRVTIQGEYGKFGHVLGWVTMVEPIDCLTPLDPIEERAIVAFER